ncbi:hypothetical protein ACFXAZ_37695 [Streptomyces sp. NPDC059477]|uniref:hypothetical protein n=1 Tax=Streptomyces sp. NPDC059477 TaxID=3346847 RepID=UPI00369A5B38
MSEQQTTTTPETDPVPVPPVADETTAASDQRLPSPAKAEEPPIIKDNQYPSPPSNLDLTRDGK